MSPGQQESLRDRNGTGSPGCFCCTPGMRTWNGPRHNTSPRHRSVAWTPPSPFSSPSVPPILSFCVIASEDKQMMGKVPALKETWRTWRDGSACWVTTTRVKILVPQLTSQATHRWLQNQMRNPMPFSSLGGNTGICIGTCTQYTHIYINLHRHTFTWKRKMKLSIFFSNVIIFSQV